MALRVEVFGISLYEWRCVVYSSESGGVCNMALRVEMCVVYGSESGGVWNVALRVEVCVIWL